MWRQGAAAGASPGQITALAGADPNATNTFDKSDTIRPIQMHPAGTAHFFEYPFAPLSSTFLKRAIARIEAEHVC